MRLIVPAVMLLVVSACGQPESPVAAVDDSKNCAQTNVMLDKADAGELVPRHWANLMVAGARLLYVDSDCGDRVNGEIVQLCSELGERITVFAESPKIPAGERRDAALNQSLLLYQSIDCQPELNIE